MKSIFEYRVDQFSMPVDFDEAGLRRSLVRSYPIQDKEIVCVEVIRRSTDARKGTVCFSLSLHLTVTKPLAELSAWEPRKRQTPKQVSLAKRPVVVGAGPAGLFAAYQLARAGSEPILLERGAPVGERKGVVGRFWSQGVLDEESNVLYGEGGAGLFSDGKLTTRTKRRETLQQILETLVACGADPDILVDAHPHVGSDRLAEVVPNLRQRILELGGSVMFRTPLRELRVDGGALVAIRAGDQWFETDHCVLATGHSARDVYHILRQSGVPLEAKPFAVGVRIEVPQKQIDLSQYGRLAGHPRLGAASYRLTRKAERDLRACYSFCMCPGGSVMACASSAGMMTTNGMSLSTRGESYGNAAFLVPVGPGDWGEGDPLAGMRWQEELERAVFDAGGGDYSVPVAMWEDYSRGVASVAVPADRSCPRSITADLTPLLPPDVTRTLQTAVPRMMRKLGAVRLRDAVVYAAETRSSSPVRIVRDQQLRAIPGLYPVGEGAGYAGGIISSAIDGWRAAESVLGLDTDAAGE